MRLRERRYNERTFAGLAFLVAFIGLAIAKYSFSAGGYWKILGALALVGEVMLAYGVLIEPRRLTVRRYREALRPHPSTWIRAVFLTDLHAGGGYDAEWWERVAIETQALGPDVIVLGGDYVIDSIDPIDELAPLAKLHAPLGKYFVLGNHDFFDQPQEIRSRLRTWGFEDLTHRSVILKHDGRELEMRGLDDQWFGTIKPFARHSPQMPHILVAHEPDTVLDVSAGETDLILAGHTHGGQVRFPLLGALWVPTKMGLADYRERKLVNGVPVIISNGLGRHKYQPRLFSPSQIVVVEVGL